MLAHFHVAEDDKIHRLKETLFGQPRMCFHSITHPDNFDGEHPATLKKMFITRWSFKVETADALYSKWQNLAFDPSKDDIEVHRRCHTNSNPTSLSGESSGYGYQGYPSH